MTDPIQRETIEGIVRQYHNRFNAGDDKNDLVNDIVVASYMAGRDRGTLQHPRYTQIDIEGRDGYYAIFSRRMRSEFIDIQLLTPEVEVQSAVPANNYVEQLIAAADIYHQLEGYRPDAAGIDMYMRPIEQLAGNYFRGVDSGQ